MGIDLAGKIQQLNKMQDAEFYQQLSTAALTITLIGRTRISFSAWANELTTEQFSAMKRHFGPLKYIDNSSSDTKRAEGKCTVGDVTYSLIIYGAMSCTPIEVDPELGPTPEQIAIATAQLKLGILKLTDCQPYATSPESEFCNAPHCTEKAYSQGMCTDCYRHAQEEYAAEESAAHSTF